ncbi:MAG TPA: Cys-tRNA(Pro) deacylase [Bacteroidetes bacterium]|jgi:Cys-tRNA(Pro) deacylase|nr:Cys-tRNA(Pro) deacylase [Bacteroidota bacterium]
MATNDYPITPAIRLLREKKISFIPHLYTYEEHGGTKASAAALNVDEHAVIKTLVMQTDARKPLIVLMHGDREVSTKQLARILDVKRIEPCDAATAQKHTGYLFGGTSPFGTRTQIPVYAEATIFSLPKIYINGGKRGFLLEITSTDLLKALPVQEVHVAIAE